MPRVPVTVTQYGIQDTRGTVSALMHMTRADAEHALANLRVRSGRTLRLVQRTIVTTPWSHTMPVPQPVAPLSSPSPRPPRRVLCDHGRVLGEDICTGCDTACERPHRSDPATIRPPWAGHTLLRCRRCGWHPAAPHHTDADQHGPLPDPRTEAGT